MIEVYFPAVHKTELDCNINGPKSSSEGVGHTINSITSGQLDVIDGQPIFGEITVGIRLVDSESLFEIIFCGIIGEDVLNS